jgi:Tfp pilus assembly major pilin PilA
MTITAYDNNTVKNRGFWLRLFSKNKVIKVSEITVGSHAWLLNVSEIDYKAFCSYLLKIGEELFVNNHTLIYQSIYIRDDLLEALKGLSGCYTTIDKKKLSLAITKSNEIVKTLSGHRNNNMQVDRKIIKKLDRQAIKVRKLVVSCFKEAPLKEASPIDLWQETPTNKKSYSLFSNKSYDVKAIRPFNRVGDRIVSAYEALKVVEDTLLTVEDKYIIQEIEETYLPNIYNAALSLKNSTPAVVEQVKNDFSIQLDFIESEIKRINGDLHKRALDTVRSQTTFALTRMNENKAIAR